MKVHDALKTGDLIEARKDLSWIVGRDTERMDGHGIARGQRRYRHREGQPGGPGAARAVVYEQAGARIGRKVAKLARGRVRGQPELRADCGGAIAHER